MADKGTLLLHQRELFMLIKLKKKKIDFISKSNIFIELKADFPVLLRMISIIYCSLAIFIKLIGVLNSLIFNNNNGLYCDHKFKYSGIKFDCTTFFSRKYATDQFSSAILPLSSTSVPEKWVSVISR